MPRNRRKPTHAGICDECGVERVLKLDETLAPHRDSGEICKGVYPRPESVVPLTPEVVARISRNLTELRVHGNRKRIASG